MKQVPLLILGDSPLGVTGLGRIGARIALNIHTHMPDVFRVAMTGLGEKVEHNLPYPFYPLPPDYSEALPKVWKEFAGDEPGILFTILNAAWLPWITHPQEPMKAWLKKYRIKKWAYVPVDAESIGGKLPAFESHILSKFDRVLAYTKFGADLIGKSIRDYPEWQLPWKLGPIPHLPHGTDSHVFYPRPRQEARASKFCEQVLGYEGKIEAGLMLGCVATNTLRKEWPTVFEILAGLKARGEDVGLWAHTQAVSHSWDLVGMANAFGVRDCVAFTTKQLSDEAMAWGYATCDVVLGAAREGWGLPLSEALACGVPVVTVNYGGATEFVPEEYRVMPWAWRWDGYFCSRTPVMRASDWADRIQWAKGREVILDPKFTWDGCWPAWESWLREGLK